MPFDGGTYQADLDRPRLENQLSLVRQLMSDGRWRTLAEVLAGVGVGSEAGISARLRDLRKPKFGGYVVERRRRHGGLWEYRVTGGSWRQREMPL